MNNSDKILFEQYFHYSGNKKINNRHLRYLINLILNSKEFNDSGIKISNKKTKGILINLSFESFDDFGMSVGFNGTYVVTDDICREGRTIEGTLVISNGEVNISSLITRCSGNTDSFTLKEIYYIENNHYYRCSIYPSVSFKDEIGYYEFEKYNDFEEKTLKRLRGKQ